jgi:hypothetical protein
MHNQPHLSPGAEDLQVKATPKRPSGAKPGMHRGPGSSKLNPHWDYIREQRRAGLTYRQLLMQLKTICKVQVSIGTLQPYVKRLEAEVSDVLSQKPRWHHTVTNSKHVPNSEAEPETDPFEAARKQALTNTQQSNARSKQIDITAVY